MGCSVQEVNLEDIQQLSTINPRKQLKVLIHGWMANRDHIATVPIRTAYLLRNEHNNLLVGDWTNASALLYPVARELVQPVGYRIASILSRLMHLLGIDYSQVHIIGHSLGAHVAGNVGNYFSGRLARITALDPAGPLFSHNSRDAVGPRAAKFVDVIHTDGLVLGELVPRGHVDFYPNHGVPPQPGCETLDVLTLHACSHYRSTGYFAESILLPNSFIAIRCEQRESVNQYKGCQPVKKEKFSRTDYSITMGEVADRG
ncbi:pancreatic lipase-related protein 2-like [Anopheles bellator]|uniref:pancreatic lipase-related protein 2-like n=1 Tax=Anopheles bellator TaxID=139047 RepID=UPI002648F46A|nr:pancreatic lipase-related protein 2-like [Anopheles bellator]